ncbi:MAG: hypothetical protein ACAH83_11560 [Alphaproteobacteria bacterium]
MKRKTGLAALFTCLAFASGAMAQEKLRPDPETAKILTSVGLTYDQAREAAGGQEVWAYYENENAAGEAFSLHGVDGSCGVSWSAEGEGLASGFSKKDAKSMHLKYDRAIDRDIEKLGMLHELVHCTQSEGAKNNEYEADEKALTFYLAQGGSRTTVQYWIYWRGVSPLLYPGKYAKSENYTPTMGTRLQAKFFGGETPDIGKTRAAYEEIIAAAAKTGKAAGPKLVHDMLSDKKSTLSPEAKQLLRFYDDGFRFLAHGPQRTATTELRFAGNDRGHPRNDL